MEAHMTTTVLEVPSGDLLPRLNGRLPSSPEEIREAIRLGEEDMKAGRCVPVEEVIAELERIVAGKA